MPMVASVLTPSVSYHGNAAFCDLACTQLQNCLFYSISGTFCKLIDHVAGMVVSNEWQIHLAKNSSIFLDTRNYVAFAGVRFTDSLISSVSIVPTSCQILCNQMATCISYTTDYTQGSNMCEFSASGLNPVIMTGKTGYLMTNPEQKYFIQSSINYLGNTILTLPGNITYCSVACDALPTCAGFVFDSLNNCIFKYGMNLTNYVVDSTVVSMILSLSNLNSINNAVQFATENTTAIPLTYTPLTAFGNHYQ